MRAALMAIVGALTLALTSGTALAASACVATQSGAWESASTWTSCGNGYPGQSGVADSATVGPYTLTTTGGETVTALTLNGASLTFTGGGTISAGHVTLGTAGATVMGDGTLANTTTPFVIGGPLTASSSAGLSITSTGGATWNAGAVTLTGTTFAVTDGGLTIAASVAGSGDASSLFDFPSGIVLSGGSTVATIDGPARLSGAITTAGSIAFSRATTVSGATSITGAGSAAFSGSLTIPSGSNLTTSVDVLLADLALATSGAVSTVLRATGGVVTMTGATTSTGSGRISLTSTASLIKPSNDLGTIQLTWSVISVGGATIAAPITIDGGILAATFTGLLAIHIGHGALVSNRATSGGLADGSIVDGAGIYGLGAGANTSGVFSTNPASGADPGHFSPALLDLGAGARFVLSGATATVTPGKVLVNNNSVLTLNSALPSGSTVPAAFHVSVDVLSIHGGQVTGDLFTDLDVAGSGTFDASAVGLPIATHGTTRLTGATTLDSTWTVTAGSTLTTAAGTTVDGIGRIVLAGGTLALDGDLELAGLQIAAGGSLTLVNETLAIALGVGALRVEAGGSLNGNGTIDASLSNAGTVTATGALVVTGSVTNTGSLSAPAGLTVGAGVTTSGTLTVSGPLAVGQTLRVEDGGVTVNGPVTVAGLDVTGGTVALTGMSTDSGDASLTAGTLAITGSLHVSGDYTQGAGGTLSLGVRSPTDLDVVSIDGATALDGTLIDATTPIAYDPAPGATARVIVAASAPTGSFATVTAPLLDGRSWVITDYATAPITLTLHYTIPASSVAPMITGSAQVGQDLTCSTGTWLNRPLSLTYTFRADGALVGTADAVLATYTVALADVGKSMTCSVTATNPAGSGMAASSNALVVGPFATTAPAVGSGTPVLGASLSCSSGVWVGSSTFSYAWLRDGQPIAGAGSSGYGDPTTYRVGSADLGHRLACAVTAQGPGIGTTTTTTPETVIGAGLAFVRSKLDAAGRLVVTLRCASSEGTCRGTVTILLAGRSAGKAKVATRGTRTTKITISRGLRARLATTRRVRAILVFRYTNGSGHARTYRLAVRLGR